MLLRPVARHIERRTFNSLASLRLLRTQTSSFATSNALNETRIFVDSSLPNGNLTESILNSTAVTHTEFSNLRAQDFANYKAKYPEWTGPYASQPSRGTMSFSEYHDTFETLASGARIEDHQPITLCARIRSRRDASAKLTFLDISARSDVPMELSFLQCIISSQRLTNADKDLSRLLRRGDWISVTGIPGKSKTGELSIVATGISLLAPCLDSLPERLEDPNIRFRTRATDLIVNEEHVWNIFRTRVTTLRTLRDHLHVNGFAEVETPILWPRAGGASARPFVTTSNAFSEDLPLSLRVAPELFLKQLVMGGMERVFELSKVFRNEGIDATHSPEFTSCELYMAHADVEDLYGFTENLIRQITSAVLKDQLEVSVPAKNRHDPLPLGATCHVEDLIIDFSKPFARLDVLETLEAHGIKLPSNFNDDAAIPELLNICQAHGLQVKAPITIPRILDKLIGDIIEPLCVQPTFIVNHPTALCPLAKRHPTREGISERFELFINCKEYVNAYSELNVPSEQYQRFASQRADQLSIAEAATNTADITATRTRDHDEEAHPVDTPYCEAMQVGLPPTAGWGMGVDRLVMLLAGVPHIRDVILFPIMKPQSNN